VRAPEGGKSEEQLQGLSCRNGFSPIPRWTARNYPKRSPLTVLFRPQAKLFADMIKQGATKKDGQQTSPDLGSRQGSPVASALTVGLGGPESAAPVARMHGYK
jgi:hypothetical protein